MMDMQPTPAEPVTPSSEPKNRSTAALLFFLLFALPMPLCLLAYHYGLWYAEQIAIASASLSNLAWAGLIGLGVQAILMSGGIALLRHFTRDARFNPIYAGWLGAALMAFPALLLRLLGPNNDQLGSIFQIVLCLVATVVFAFLRKIKMDWRLGNLSLGFMLAAFGVAPFAVLGAFGSLTDAALSLLAALSFGLLAATLIESTTGNLLLDAFGIGALLALLGSAIGYDGAQLILLGVLPPFAFSVSALMPSRSAGAALTGVMAAAALTFFDPTELTILLGDVGQVAIKACAFTLGLGWAVGLVALIVRSIAGAGSGSAAKRVVSIVGALAAWTILVILFFTTGHPGNYGDRLFVILKDQADLSNVSQIKDRQERLTAAYQTLTQYANKTQAGLRNTFDTFGIDYTPYYLVNGLEVRGGTLVRLYLMTRPEVDRVIPSPRLRPAPSAESMQPDQSSVSGSPQWNVTMIGADKVWEEFGARGQGIVVGQSDSGADGRHPALRDQYRGLTVGDDYNWFDPWGYSSSPTDEGGHGTHTLGSILGKNGIGIAPEAKWFACANLRRNLGDPALYLDCMQFMLAPFPQGSDPFKDGDPTKAAHVLNNSWGCPEIEGCDPNALKAAADALRAAGIFVVVSTGNDGPNCSTVNAPLSLYDSVFSVGAIDQHGNMAAFSSRGPVTADDSGRMKPDIAAPGVDILSSVPGGGYGHASGTSMAGPHVAGVVALLWSADPSLIGDIDRTEQILIESATPYSGDRSFGCFEGDRPNAAYGYGIVNVYEAVKMALGK